jgi:hypothetical protein
MTLMMTLALFQQLSNWHDTCLSNCKSAEDKSQRTRRVSNGNYIRQCREIFKGLENGEGSCVLRRVRHQRQPLDESLTSSDGLSL